MNMVGHSANFYEYRSHSLDYTSDIFVETCKIVVQNVCSFGFGVENDM